MSKKTLGLFLTGTLFFFCSCVDDTYDLNKGVSTDVAIKGNRLALPLGSLRAIMLDSLINVEELGILNKKDGAYSISMADTIAPYEYEMPEIKFAIPAQKANVTVDDFAEAEITEVHIEGQTPKGTQFTVPEISLSDLKIPDINTDRSVSAANDPVKNVLNQYSGTNGSELENQDPIPFDQTFELNDGEVEFNLNYELPEEINTLYSIFLKKQEDDDNSENGALIEFEIVHPIALKDLDKTIDFKITFPEEFSVALAPVTTGGQYSLVEENGHTILVKGLTVNAGDESNSSIRFYINSLNNLERSIENGILNLDKTITYSVDYYVNGLLKLQSNTQMEDFDFKVIADLGLSFRDVQGKTNDLEIDFEPITMDFNIDFNNLQYIDRIEYIDFDANQSKLHFHTEMEGGFAPFTLKEGYALKLKFPDELIIDDEKSVYPRTSLDGKKAVQYIADEHAYYIYDLEVFNSLIEDKDSEGNPLYYHWALALDRFDLHAPVANGEFHHTVEALVSIDYVGESKEQLVLASTTFESLNKILESLDDKEVNFSIWNSDFVIDDAMVHTEKIVSELSHTIPFDFNNNDLPKEIRRIEGIGFNGEAPINFNIKVNGLEDLKTDITLDLQVKLPSALEVSSNDERVSFKDDILLMKVDLDPSSQTPAKIELMCNGLDFTKGAENNGLRPEIKNDKGFIEYNSDIELTGNVYVEGSDFHAEVLESEISVDVDFEIGDILVKDFHGIFYIDNLGNIEETFDLNLGEGLDFLSNENNTIVLSDPQISISVDNSISIPISANLSLVGKDANGQVIESSIIESEIKIEAAEYDQATGEVTPHTTNLLISAHPIEKEGYTNLPVENLANLLKQIPASIDIALTPVIDTTSTQHINLVQPLSFSGNYEVAIPLQFDEFSFVYSDTIAGIGTGIGDMLEMFSNVKLGLNMDIKNSMPLQLQFKATPLDEYGDSIPGLSISGFEIPAGTGEAFSDTIAGKEVNFSIESRSTENISQLDKLKFEINAKANSTVGGVALRGEQGLKLENISIEVVGDVTLGE